MSQTDTLLQAVLESSPEVIVFALDGEYRYLTFNQRHREAMRRIWGRDIAVGQSMLEVISSEEDREKARMGFDRALAGESFVVEDEYGDTELQRLYWQNFMGPIRDGSGAVVGLTVFVLNISERRLAERALSLREQEFRTLVEHSADHVARHDRDLRRTYVNPAFAAAVPGGEAELLGRTPMEHPGGSNAEGYQELMAEVIRTGEPAEFELLWSPAPDQEICTLVGITPEWDAEGQVVSLLTVGRDVTELQRSRAKIHQMAFFDSLTGLPNRALFHDRLNQTIADSSWRGWTSALMMLDLDRFKAINDTMGHGAGDGLLREVARRLESCLRPYDTVARLGGDEFTILLPNVRETDDLGRIANKVLEQFARPFDLDGQEVVVSSSIGIALYPHDSTEAEELVKFADSAMYHAKQSGRNGFRLYSPELTRGALERLSLEVDLRRALERRQLQVYFQPLVAMSSGRVVGSEALVRWAHPEHGFVPPVTFIPIAEDTGLIGEIGRWVLAESCRAAVRRNVPGKPAHRIAVNVSPRQLESLQFLTELDGVLAVTGCDPRWLELEITERILMDETGVAPQVLTALRERGITVAIDDFGTGYSALSYLTRFPLDTLKIDRTFIEEATAEPGRAGLIGAVMLIAECLGLRVIAEGVESAEQAAVLQQQGCEFAQGYWYARPLPAEQFEALPTVLPEV